MNKIIIPILVIVVTIIGINNAFALESNTEYFVDSKNAFMIISGDSSGKTSLLEGGISISDKWEYWDNDTLKLSRIIQNGDTGKFFGKTDAGNLFYAMYEINEDSVQLKIKIWHDGIKTRIIETGTVESLF
jgi:hypothetical protein